MGDYSDHVRLLVLSLLVLVVVFLVGSLFEQRELAGQLVFSIAVIVLVILILARFGGDLGRTL